MKKLLSILAGVTLSTTSIATVVSCDIKQNTNLDLDSMVGMNIDRSKAIDDSTNEGRFTNFYTVGDSLSDVSGLTSILSSALKREKGKEITFGEPSYKSSFTNGPTAAAILAEELGIQEFKTGFNFELGKDKHEEFGKNYSVGGATAATISGGLGIVLNKFKIQDQAEALLKQHKTKPTDLVFFEIGGNDLFGMIGKPQKEQANLMQDAMKNIKNALLTLLNNDLKNIVVMNAPNVSKLPTYNHLSLSRDADVTKEVTEEASELSKEFNVRLEKLFNELNAKYNNSMKLYDLETKFNKMLEDFTGTNTTDAATSMSLNFEEIIETGVIKANYNAGVTAQTIDQYFFYDAIHPTKWAHEQVAEDILKSIQGWGVTNEKVN